MTTPSKDANIRRSATRAPVGRPIKLQFDDSMDVIEGLCRNVSIGGMFISFENSRPAGSLVRFELELDESNAIRGLGEVVWMKSKSDFGGPESGFGLKFRFLEQRDRQMIFKLVSQHIKERLSKREPEVGDAAEAASESELPALDVAIPPSPAPPSLEASADPAEEALESADLTDDVSKPDAPELPLQPQPTAPELSFESPAFESPAFESPPMDTPSVDTPPVAEAAEFDLAPPTHSEPEPPPGALLPALDEMPAAELEAAETSQAPAGPVGLDPIDLDPSVGQTPMYELGLESEPTPAVDNAPARDSLGFGGGEAEPDTVEDTDLRPDDSARGEVWGEPVTRTGRQFSLLPVVVVILIAIAAAAFLFKDQLVARFGSDPPVSAASGGPAATATEGPSQGGVEDPTSGAPSAVVDPETHTPSTTSDASSAVDEPAEQPPMPTLPPPRVTPPPPAPPPPAPPPPVAAVSVPPSTTSPSATATGAEFTRLVDIAWSEAAGGMKIILTANGSIPTGRYRYFRLAGDSPREVVKLMGVDKRYPKDTLTVGGPGVRQIRVGFHRAAGSHEIHVVMDLTDPRWVVSEVSNVGSSLELLLTEH